MKKLFLALILGFGAVCANDFDIAVEAYNNGDFTKSAEYYKKVCDGGVDDTYYNVGVLYDTGLGVKQDYKEANKYYKMACDGGVDEGCFSLGFSYENAQEVKKNYTTAKKYFGKTCDFGFQLGCGRYADLNRQGY
ncbi:MAG: sel1 repeat family protein [Campylobacter sp.]|nr:sel1 repeat family protein [Campylobacter sp.]